jgi:hypothetical protein
MIPSSPHHSPVTEQRRYREEEVREIFEVATRQRVAGPPAPAAQQGLTLDELQQIGIEVGVEPGAVARAAAMLEARPLRATRRTSLGLPVEVGRLVPLPRPLTDEEWEEVVATLRSTFGARGRRSEPGAPREWFNGNLHACVERSDTGHRLLLGTRKGDAASLNALGVTGVVTGAVAFGAMFLTGGLASSIFVPGMIGGSGVAALLANAVRLPGWAQRREEQMEHVAERVAAMVHRQLEAGDAP